MHKQQASKWRHQFNDTVQIHILAKAKCNNTKRPALAINISTIRYTSNLLFFLHFRSIRTENTGTKRPIPNVSPLDMGTENKGKRSRTYGKRDTLLLDSKIKFKTWKMFTEKNKMKISTNFNPIICKHMATKMILCAQNLII